MFQNNVALVTGAASGIGKSVAEYYAKNGARVVLSDVDDDAGMELAKALDTKGDSAIYIHADVSNPEDCKAMVDKTLEKWGRLDYACNNAGISGEQNPAADISVAGWQNTIAVNLSGVFYCMKYEIDAMLKNGKGSIVNMASILSSVGFKGGSAYAAAKHGVLGLSKTAAVEYAEQGIRINSIGPGFIETPLLSDMDDATMNYLKSLHPMGRLGKPEEVAELVMWLSSDASSFVTGSYYPVDGGYLAL